MFHKLLIVICKIRLWCCWLILAWAPQAAINPCAGQANTVQCEIPAASNSSSSKTCECLCQSCCNPGIQTKKLYFNMRSSFYWITWIVGVFEKWMFGCICRWHPWVSLKSMHMASAVKGDCVFRLVTSQSTEVHVITQDLGIVFVFPSVLRKYFFFLWWIFFSCRICTVNCTQPGEWYYWRVWGFTEESSCEKFCHEFYHLSYI